MPFNIGGGEAIFLLLITLVVFGAGRLPEVLGQLGRGVRSFQDAASGRSDEPAAAGASACDHCGKALPRDARFCAYCGRSAA